MLRQAAFFFLLFGTTQAGNTVGQLSGTRTQSHQYPANTEITEFQADKTFRGFSHENGRLKVQECGSYYIYAQVFFQIDSSAPTYHNRVALAVNGNTFSLTQTGLGGMADYGSVFTGGIVQLHEGDYISLITVYHSNLWVAKAHTFFGAYRIDQY